VPGIRGGGRIHLAVLTSGYIQRILSGRKTIEARLSVTRRAPFEQISQGDWIALKESSGPVTALAKASRVWFCELPPETLESLQQRFAERVAADSVFWEERGQARNATFIELTEIRAIAPIVCRKRDQSA